MLLCWLDVCFGMCVLVILVGFGWLFWFLCFGAVGCGWLGFCRCGFDCGGLLL